MLSPKNDTHYREMSYYNGTQDWVRNASMWLLEKGCRYVFLFGFSAGGVVAAYEIQKDYATIFSAAVIADAPVDNDTYGDIFNSADTASEAKVCTSLIVGKDDMQLGNITEQMENYYDNVLVHKEWHTWNNGTGPHDPFPDTCLTHPGETVFDATYSWYQHRHSLTVLAQDQNGSVLTKGDVYIDDELVGYVNSTFPVLGPHPVYLNAFWDHEDIDWRWRFKNWTDGSNYNPRNVTVIEDTTITANFTKKKCPGDADGNGIVNILDTLIVSVAFGSTRDLGDPWPPQSGKWDSRADMATPRDYINILDMLKVSVNFGKEYP